eukprot:scaffold140779_cov45-Attheya_sp.AAC.2
MVWSRVFPPAGGGTVRRWVNLQKALWQKGREKEHILKGPIPLFDFDRVDDAADARAVEHGPTKGGWRTSDDEVIGGYSRASMTLIQTQDEFHRHLRKTEITGEAIPHDKESSSAAEEQTLLDDDSKEGKDDSFRPFIRWEGNLDTRIGKDTQISRSGFCALRSPVFNFTGANLGEKYNALEITCRPDNRLYTLNLCITSYFPDDMYQGFINAENAHVPIISGEEDGPNNNTPGGEFVSLILPFRGFVLTSAGRMREVQRDLDGAVKIEHMGLTLMDEKDGPFTFDLSSIRAVNYYDGQILGEDDEDSPY